MNELELFAGAGGGILGSQLLGHRTVCAVEFDAYARSVLLARQADGVFPPFPVWDDVRTFDGRPWRGIVDVVSGGFPCQDISVAGKGAGIDGERSGLWGEMARIIGEVRPYYAWLENSSALLARGFGRIVSDLAALGYDCRWTVLGASDVGASHRRDRLWVLASDADRKGLQGRKQRSEAGLFPLDDMAAPRDFPRSLHDLPKPIVFGSGHGVANRAHRLKAIGNGQVPQCRAAAWRMLGGC